MASAATATAHAAHVHGASRAGVVLTPEQLVRVRNVAAGIVGTEHAEDVAQTVALRVWRKGGTFRGEAKFSTWLYSVTVNEALQMRRAARAERRGGGIEDVPLDEAFGVHDVAPDALSTLLADERTRLLLDAVASLPSPNREIVAGLLAGHTMKSVAQAYGVGNCAMKSRMWRSILPTLRTYLEGRGLSA